MGIRLHHRSGPPGAVRAPRSAGDCGRVHARPVSFRARSGTAARPGRDLAQAVQVYTHFAKTTRCNIDAPGCFFLFGHIPKTLESSGAPMAARFTETLLINPGRLRALGAILASSGDLQEDPAPCRRPGSGGSCAPCAAAARPEIYGRHAACPIWAPEAS